MCNYRLHGVPKPQKRDESIETAALEKARAAWSTAWAKAKEVMANDAPSAAAYEVVAARLKQMPPALLDPVKHRLSVSLWAARAGSKVCKTPACRVAHAAPKVAQFASASRARACAMPCAIRGAPCLCAARRQVGRLALSPLSSLCPHRGR